MEEMNQAMVDRWNSVVTDKDVVYHLGDFSFAKDQQQTIELLNKLNGSEIHLILGNHDKHMKAWVKEKFTSCQPYKEIYLPDTEAYGEKQFIVLIHYAMRVWNKSHRGSWQLYGHSHGSLPDDPHSRNLDVGVDCWDFTPVSYEKIKERMKLKTPRSIDHHQMDL
jgi:calcineurin-like phosphoesterase family protein